MDVIDIISQTMARLADLKLLNMLHIGLTLTTAFMAASLLYCSSGLSAILHCLEWYKLLLTYLPAVQYPVHTSRPTGR